MNRIFILILFICSLIYALTDVDKQDLTGLKLNQNGGFENGIYGYSVDSGATISLETVNIHSGTKAVKFIGSATVINKKFESSLFFIPSGTYCLTYFYYKTSSNDFVAAIYDNSNNLISSVLYLASNTAYERATPLSFACSPAPVKYKVRITDTGVTQVPIYADDIFVGDNPNSLPIAGLTATRVPYISSTATLTDTSNLTWTNATNLLNLVGELRLGGSTSGYVGLKGSSAAGSVTYIFPTSDGTPGYPLATDGSGNLSWLQLDHNLLNNLAIGDYHSQYAYLNGRTTGQVLYGGVTESASLTLRSTSNGTKGKVVIDETTQSSNLTDGALNVLGGASVARNLQVGQSLVLHGSTSGSVSFITAPSTSGSYILPVSDGTTGYGLATDGSGNLAWTHFALAGVAPVTGSGTINTIPKFTGSTAVGNSNITDTGSLVSISGSANISGIEFPTVYNDVKNATGFLDQTAVLSFSDASISASITGTHSIYINGVKLNKNTTTIPIANTTGLHWIYYNLSGVLTEGTFPGFNYPLMATVYWNAVTATGLIANERHGISMSTVTHEYLHNTIGARYQTGLTGSFLNASFSISGGIIYDEDLKHTISGTQTVNTVLYKDGAADFKFDLSVATPYKAITGAIKYNNVNTLTSVGSNNYVANWVFATNDIINPILTMIGQREDTNINNARTNNTYDSLTFGALPYSEMKLLYRVIYRNVGGVATFIESADYRAVSTVTSGTYVATSHMILSDLTLGDSGHTQFLLLNGRNGGQIAYGSDLASEDLTLRSTSDITKGKVIIDETTVSSNLTDGALNILGGASIAKNLRVGTSLALHGSTSGSISFLAAPSTSGNYTLPVSDGLANTFLSTNGSAVLSWALPSTDISSPGVQSSNYPIQTSDLVVLLDGTSNTVDATLYVCNVGNTGKHLWIKAINTANAVRVLTAGENIDNSPIYVFPGQMSAIHVFCQTSTWYIIGAY